MTSGLRGGLLAGAAIALFAAPRVARAEPDAGLAIVTGAATNVAGFLVGGAILSTGHTLASNNAGWLTLESGFVLSPLVAHAVEGEWGRGLLFSAVPLACLGGTATLFGVVPNTVDQGSLPQQRLMWGLFVGGQFASAVGIVDAAFAPLRASKIRVVPIVGLGQVGLSVGGEL